MEMFGLMDMVEVVDSNIMSRLKQMKRLSLFRLVLNFVILENSFVAQGRSQKRIDAIEFITDKGVVHGPFGGNGGNPFVSSHPGEKH